MSRAIRVRALRLILVGLSLCGLRAEARAESHQRAIGFSRLMERTEIDTPMRLGQQGERVFILEQLRNAGLRVVGGDETVFAPADPTATEELVLGGSVTVYECRRFQYLINCRLGVHWQVQDQRSSQVIYEATARVASYDIRPETTVVDVGRALLKRALDSLLLRPRFVALLARDVSSEGDVAAAPEALIAPDVQRLSDESDAMPSLDPEGDARRAEATQQAQAVQAYAAAAATRRAAEYDSQQRRLAAQDRADAELERRTPAYIPAMRWGGVALGAFGLIAAAASQLSYDRDTTTQKDFETLRLWNDLGWVSAALGSGSLTASFLLAPRLPNTQATIGATRVQPPSALLVGVRGEY